jgi:hypothetical protein
MSRPQKLLVHSLKERKKFLSSHFVLNYVHSTTQAPDGRKQTTSPLSISWGHEKGHYVLNSELKFPSCEKNLWGLEKGWLVLIFHKFDFPLEDNSGSLDRTLLPHYSINHL